MVGAKEFSVEMVMWLHYLLIGTILLPTGYNIFHLPYTTHVYFRDHF